MTAISIKTLVLGFSILMAVPSTAFVSKSKQLRCEYQIYLTTFDRDSKDASDHKIGEPESVIVPSAEVCYHAAIAVAKSRNHYFTEILVKTGTTEAIVGFTSISWKVNDGYGLTSKLFASSGWVTKYSPRVFRTGDMRIFGMSGYFFDVQGRLLSD